MTTRFLKLQRELGIYVGCKVLVFYDSWWQGRIARVGAVREFCTSKATGDKVVVDVLVFRGDEDYRLSFKADDFRTGQCRALRSVTDVVLALAEPSLRDCDVAGLKGMLAKPEVG